MPDEIEDEGLAQVWARIRDFFAAPSERPKRPSHLFQELMEPPFGVRAGLLPILFAAGLKAFPSALSLTRDGAYVADVLPSDIEDLCKDPDRYEVTVLDLDPPSQVYLEALQVIFGNDVAGRSTERDLMRSCFDAIQRWKAELPVASMSTYNVSEAARQLQMALNREADPVQLLFHDIPSSCGQELSSQGKLLEAIRSCKSELEGVVAIYEELAANSVRQAIAYGQVDGNIRETAAHWAECFSNSAVQHLSDSVSRGIVTRMQMQYQSDRSLIESLSSLLVGKSFGRWDDGTVHEFDRAICDAVHRIEEALLSSDVQLPLGDGTIEGIVELARGRASGLYDRLARLVGPEEAKYALKSAIDAQAEES